MHLGLLLILRGSFRPGLSVTNLWTMCIHICVRLRSTGRMAMPRKLSTKARMTCCVPRKLKRRWFTPCCVAALSITRRIRLYINLHVCPPRFGDRRRRCRARSQHVVSTGMATHELWTERGAWQREANQQAAREICCLEETGSWVPIGLMMWPHGNTLCDQSEVCVRQRIFSKQAKYGGQQNVGDHLRRSSPLTSKCVR